MVYNILLHHSQLASIILNQRVGPGDATATVVNDITKVILQELEGKVVFVTGQALCVNGGRTLS